MKLQSKRLFINNLPNNISVSDLEEKFSHYGNVDSVEIKQRKNIGINQTGHFAYININIENTAVHNCIDEFTNKKWKGHWLEVQEAKESFMERLKREREEQKINGTAEATQIVTTNIPNSVDTNVRVVNNRKYHSSSSESSEEGQEDSGFTSSSNCNKKRKIRNDSITQDETEIKIVKKPAIISNDTVEIESSPKNMVQNDGAKKLSSKEIEADKKRLQSIAQMKKGYQQQKSAIKNALANIDIKPKNKIVFNDNGDNIKATSKSQSTKLKETSNSENKYYSSSQKKLQLFNEEDEEVSKEHETSYNFEVKEHFEGKKGQKLMKLQSKFKNDKRFAMDARFLEDEKVQEEDDEETEDKEEPHDDEKQKQFEILEEVLGKKIVRPAGKSDKATESKTSKMMLRFDPTQPEHSKYEVKDTTKQEKKKKKSKDIEEKNESSVVEEAPVPEVSKDTFYKVAVDLKTTLQEKEGFSLAEMFSKNIESVEMEEQEKQPPPVDKDKNKQSKMFVHENNPFRYDSSSDSEDEEIPSANAAATTENTSKPAASWQQRSATTKLWTESFFFKSDDYRLQEGVDFIKRLEADDQDDFHKLRRNLKEIVRAKVKNNQRKNRPFKKKLGGKKRIRVKRALKR